MAEAVIKTQGEVGKFIEENNCIKAALVERAVTADYESHTAYITYKVMTGNRVKFGKTTFEGLKNVKAEHLAKMLEWQQDECFNKSKVAKTQGILLQSGLLANVEHKLIESSDGYIDVIFVLSERKHRTIKAGVRFDTDEGLGINADWQHRNFYDEGQHLTVGTNLSSLFKTLYAKFDQPIFLRDDQSFNITTEFKEENLDAFDALKFDASATVRRQIDEQWAAGTGVQYGLSEVEKLGDDELYGLFGIPVFVEHDSRNDVFNPLQGVNFRAKATPFIDTLDVGTYFLKMRVDGSYYSTFERAKWTPTFAIRGAMGSIMGADLEDVPPDERFYAGGGGSVRGYGFQKLGPQIANIPDGGRSFVEVSTEARLKFTDTIGAVAFVDGGNAYSDNIPEIGGEMRWAVGLGARYFTDFAPIRFDVAIPLDRRDDVDDPFQIYISIGQAF